MSIWRSNAGALHSMQLVQLIEESDLLPMNYV
jgi:hypothetical protein